MEQCAHKVRSQRKSGVFMICLGIGLVFLFGGDGNWGMRGSAG